MELIGNESQVNQVEECIKQNKPVLIHGPPGIGKTYSVHYLAKKLGYSVVEFNASDERKKEDFEYLISVARSKGLKKRIILLDEADGIEDFRYVKRLINESKNPIVLTANEIWKIPDWIQKMCTMVRYYPPKKKEIVDFLRKHYGDDIKFDRVCDDVRQSIIAATTGSQPYTETNIFQEVKKIFKRQDFEFGDSVLWIYLIDNVHKFYKGKKLFDAIQIIVKANLYDNPRLLKVIPYSESRAEVEYPYYLQRRSVMKNELDR